MAEPTDDPARIQEAIESGQLWIGEFTNFDRVEAMLRIQAGWGLRVQLWFCPEHSQHWALAWVPPLASRSPESGRA